MSSSPDTNPEFDVETERKLRLAGGTPPIQPMPDFKPFVTEEQLNVLNKLDERDRIAFTPIFKLLNVQDLRQMHSFREEVITRGGLREQERKSLDRIGVFKAVILFVCGGLFTAGIGGFAYAIAEKLLTK